jgi:glycosyltransferase involved in cell wall biosynthesis
LWFLKNAWPKIRERTAGSSLYIVGANPPSELRRLNGQNNIAVTGWVEDVRPFLKQAAVFVAPILDGVGLRGKVLEAWAMERPVVGTGLAFEGLRPREGETCFIANDAEAFARRTCELLENRELARRMGRLARQVVLDSFSWDAFGELYENVYSTILGKGRFAARETCAEVAVERLKS